MLLYATDLLLNATDFIYMDTNPVFSLSPRDLL